MAAAVFSLGCAYALGFRSFTLLAAVGLALFLPSALLMEYILGSLIPPKPGPYQPEYFSLDISHVAPGHKDKGGKPKPPLAS